MARKLLRQALAVATGLALTATMFLGVGMWRRSQDATWCRQATASGVVSGEKRMPSAVLEEIRSACAVQRERQRRLFGSLWRQGGQQAAQCGFELARLQLVSYADPEAVGPVLQRYGITEPGFDFSDRVGQDRFVMACLSSDHRAG